MAQKFIAHIVTEDTVEHIEEAFDAQIPQHAIDNAWWAIEGPNGFQSMLPHNIFQITYTCVEAISPEVYVAERISPI